MEINSLQVGQSFAVSREDLATRNAQNKLSQQELSSEINSQTKGIEISADIQKQEQGENSLERINSPERVNSLERINSPEKIEEAVSQISDFVQASSRQLTFSVDEDSNKQVVKVTDAESGDVIRQIPSEEVLELSERLQNLQTEVGTAVGLLFNKQV